MDYENRIVGYVDILGFRAMIERSRHDRPEVRRISDGLNYISKFGEELKKDDSGIHATVFSDHIVVSCPRENSDAFVLIEMLRRGSRELAKHGFFVRGSITHGQLIHNDDCVFGPALVDAYVIESQIAFYPRIIVRSDVVQLYKDIARPVTKGMVPLERAIAQSGADAIFPACDDGNRRLEYFAIKLDELEGPRGLLDTDESPRDRAIKTYADVRDQLVVALEACEDGKAVAQLSWLASTFNSALRKARLLDDIREVMPTLILRGNMDPTPPEQGG